MTSRISIDGIDLAYEERGEGFPLLAIHGFYPDRRLMTGAFEPLFDAADRARVPPSAACGLPQGGATGRSYRRVYLDLPFMGESSDPEAIRDSDDMLALVAAFARAIIPEGPFLLAGESYGGYLARGLHRTFASDPARRVEGIAFLCPLIYAPVEERTLPALTALRVEPGYAEGGAASDIREFDDISVVRTPYTWKRSAAEVLSGCSAARAPRLEELRARGYAFGFDLPRSRAGGPGDRDGQPFDPPFAGPALFALGRQDASTGWSDALRLAPRYPRASYAILDMAGHNLQIEQAGLFGALVGEWLGRCEAEARARGAA